MVTLLNSSHTTAHIRRESGTELDNTSKFCVRPSSVYWIFVWLPYNTWKLDCIKLRKHDFKIHIGGKASHNVGCFFPSVWCSPGWVYQWGKCVWNYFRSNFLPPIGLKHLKNVILTVFLVHTKYQIFYLCLPEFRSTKYLIINCK